MSDNVPVIESKLITERDGCACCTASLSSCWSDDPDIVARWKQVKQVTAFRLGRASADGQHSRTVVQVLCDECLLAFAEVVKLAAEDAQNRIADTQDDSVCIECGQPMADGVCINVDCKRHSAFAGQ